MLAERILTSLYSGCIAVLFSPFNQSFNMQRHRAFTLVELLVVIAIIGVVAALLLPAIQSVRMKSARTHCMTQCSPTGHRFANYVEANKQFPVGSESQAFMDLIRIIHTFSIVESSDCPSDSVLGEHGCI